MSVTVLIVNYNSGRLLADCLAYLAVQSVQPEQVIVIDNASTDDSVAVVHDFENVVLRIVDRNLGFAAANNHGIDLCTTKYVAVLNPDAFPAPNWLEHLLAVADQHPEYAAFGSRQLMYQQPERLDGVGDKYHITGLVWRDRHGEIQSDEAQHPREIFSPCAAAALYRRQALMDAAGFDNDYFCYVEDVDLGFRLRLVGHKATYVPDAVVHHVGSASSGGQRSDFAVYHGHRNLVWTFLKNMPGALFWVLLPLHLVMNLVSIAVFTLRGQGKLILRAKWDAIKGLPAIWKKRREIQSRRVATVRDIWRMLDKRLFPRVMRRRS